MPETKTQRSNGRFVVQRTPDGKPVVIIELYQDTIPNLNRVSIGFDLVGVRRKKRPRKSLIY